MHIPSYGGNPSCAYEAMEKEIFSFSLVVILKGTSPFLVIYIALVICVFSMVTQIPSLETSSRGELWAWGMATAQQMIVHRENPTRLSRSALDLLDSPPFQGSSQPLVLLGPVPRLLLVPPLLYFASTSNSRPYREVKGEDDSL